MKLIIAGSRKFTDFADLLINYAVGHFDIILTEDDTIISGGAKGIDQAADTYAYYGAQCMFECFKADWNKHGKGAGYIRNATMAREGDALLAIWDGESRGTLNMIETMKKLGKPTYVLTVSSERFNEEE